MTSALAVILLGAVCAASACGDNPTGVATDDATSPEAGGSEASATDSPSADSPDEVMTEDARVDGALLSPKFVFRDINHILSTGQSLSIGLGGDPILSSTQPFANLKFPGGPKVFSSGLTSFVPLVEEGVETMSSGLANLVTKMARDEVLVGQPAGQTSHDILVSLHGVSGVPYTALKKNGTTSAFADGIAQAQAGHALATSMGKSHVVRVITNVHGENDDRDGTTTYEQDLLEWQSNYDTDVRAITGQQEPIPMLHTQLSNWTMYAMKATSPLVVMDQLRAHIDAPGKIILVGAKYHLEYSDGIHLTNIGYRQMGEYYAKVYRHVILEGKTWEPVRPKSVTRVGAVVTVKMYVPVPPLVIDTTLVTDPGHYGFEWADDAGAGSPTITSVAITAPDTVQITLSATPTAGNKRLRYAFTGIPGARAGATTGARGNLRDSDATSSPNGNKLYNWGVHFDVVSP